MAYNLQSLITILEKVLDPQQTRLLHDRNKPKLASFLRKAVSLQQILEEPSAPKIESLDCEIRDAAHKVEDIIESCMVDQMLSDPEGVTFSFSKRNVRLVRKGLDSVMEKVVKLMDGDQMSSVATSSSGASFSSSKSIVVGVDADLKQLKERLIGTRSKVEIIPIVGMGGVGKTTLARKLYEDPLIVSRFRTLAWTTVSQDYNMQAILSCLLHCIVGKDFTQPADELKDILYRSLYGKRYMIVLDDIWNTKFWDEIRKYFPDNNNGSRILITTRESEVANYADSQSLQHHVQLLGESQSWDLLRQIVFGEDDCRDDVLQVIGEKIASDCGGLPLAINVIGGLLLKVQRSQSDWENIAKDVRAAITESDKHFSRILSLSYNHLPNHLKPCFLYFGAFPEDHDIDASKLIYMYIAEGFVRSIGDRSLEEEAECCLKALVERNLIFVAQKKLNGKPSIYNIHDLLRDVCLRKGDEDEFLHVKNAPETTSSNTRRVSVHSSHGLEDGCASAELMPLARSFMSIHSILFAHKIPSPVFFKLGLLRVLDVIKIYFWNFPREILQLVSLRYLTVSCDIIPTGISKLCNLQTLVASLRRHDVAPSSELWEMPELRYINIVTLTIMEEDLKRFVLKKLQTIFCLKLTSSLIERGFFKKIPNIKTFGIRYYADEDEKFVSSRPLDLSQLDQLETLELWHGVHRFKFPSSLRELTLSACAIFPAVLTTLCALPKLEVLEIGTGAFMGKNDEAHGEWEAAEEDVFSSLQILRLSGVRLRRWSADETNFPRLRRLVIRDCLALEEIPSAFAEITALQIIELQDCSDSSVASAKHIQQLQQSELDDYSLQLRITGTSSA